MSFGSKIKEELTLHIAQARHCQIAELSALYKYCNKDTPKTAGSIVFSSENEMAAQKCFTLLRKTYNMYKEFQLEDFKGVDGSASYSIAINKNGAEREVVEALLSDTVTLKSCCRRAYIRGAFLACGSVTDPEKSYHLEFVCQDESDARFLLELFATFDVVAKIVKRKKYFVLYVKDGTQIVDVLNIMEAHVAMMDFENARILKEVRNSVNRKCNCEMANIGKTISAAQKQIDDINILMQSKEYKKLPDSLREMAELRIQNPEATLVELGKLADPPIGKSGVNHRLRKLCEMAETVS